MNKPRHKMTAALLAAAILIWSGAVFAQTDAPNAATGSAAEKILARYAEVTGGQAVYDKINSRYTKSTVTVGPSVKLDLTTYLAKPNKLYSHAQSAATGDIERGFDGEIFWEKSTMGGPRILEGKERAAVLGEMEFDKYVYWRNVYDKAEATGTDTVNGSLCDLVVMTPKNGKPQTFYFDRASGLLVRITLTIEHQMGEIPVDMYLSDYRPANDVLMPRRMLQKVMTQEMVTVIDSVVNNVELPADVFKVPDDVKALIKK